MKAIVVTGATSGIGLAVCRALAAKGFTILGVGHSEANCQQARDGIVRDFPQVPVKFFCGDLMQQREVLRIAAEIRACLADLADGRLYALINNAGCVRSWYATTEDGYEQQFALNHLAGFLLTHQLMPCLINGSRAGGGRILMTASASHQRMKIRWHDPMLRKGYHPLVAYKQSKLCNMLFAAALNERFAGVGIRAYGIDPGLVRTDIGFKQTGGLVALIWSLRKKGGVAPEIPAQTYAWLCEQPKAPTGLYYGLCTEKKHSAQVNSTNAARLFTLSEQLCGVDYGRYVTCLP